MVKVLFVAICLFIFNLRAKVGFLNDYKKRFE